MAATLPDETLVRAVRALSSLDPDGAATLNSAGWSKIDVALGHSLAERDPSTWTVRQTRAAWRMLAKYRHTQLPALGVDYLSIPEPPASQNGSAELPRIGLDEAHDNGRYRADRSFTLFFGYDPGLVAEVKALPTRYWCPEHRHWTVPAKAETVPGLLKLSRTGWEISAKAAEAMLALTEQRQANVAASRAEASTFEVPGLGVHLRPFQRAGVEYLARTKRAFLADQMGLGKTIQALATLQATGAYPALVICPASLKLFWAREARKALPSRTVAVTNGKTAPADVDVEIINYDILGKHADRLKARRYQAVILDECHFVKNHRAKRTVLAGEIAKGAEVRLGLSGTPLLNRPQELLSQLGILGRLNDLGGFWAFARHYCDAYQSRFGWDFSGAQHLGELNEKLRATCYVRRLKADVLRELPAKQRANVPVEIDNQQEYDRAASDLLSYVAELAQQDEAFARALPTELSEQERARVISNHANDAAARAARAEVLVRIGTLRQVVARGKLAAIIDWTRTFLDGGEKLVLFAHHIEIQDALIEAFPDCAKLQGDDDSATRQANVDRFQTDPECRLIVCSIRAGGIGVTLTAASDVAFAELDWTPAALDQAEDRTHRIGQQNAVTAWYLLADNTIDDDLYALVERKRTVIDAVTDGIAPAGDQDEIGTVAELVEMLGSRWERRG